MKKVFYGLITILLLLFVSILLYDSVLKVGLDLREQSKYLEYTFYAIAGLLFYALVLRPMAITFFAPYYSVSRYCGEKTKRLSTLTHRAKRLMRCGDLRKKDIEELEAAVKERKAKKLGHRMSIIYHNTIKKNIDKMTLETARDIFCITAISQNGAFDMFTVLVNNIRLIKRIVVMCGFRPTFIRMCKIYINILFGTLIADGAQKIDFAALIGTSMNGTLKILANSAMGGAVNAFLVLRVGMLAKGYIYSENAKKDKDFLRGAALEDAISMFPSLLASVIISPLKSIASLFMPAPKAPEEDDGEDKDVKNIVKDADWSWRSKKGRNG